MRLFLMLLCFFQLTLPATLSRASMRQTDVVAEYRYQSIFLIRGYPLTRGIRILQDGKIVSFQITGFGERSKNVSSVSKKQIDLLSEKAQALKPDELVEGGVCGPCLMTGAETYSVYHENGDRVVLRQVEKCKAFRLKSSDAEIFQKILDGFAALEAIEPVQAG